MSPTATRRSLYVAALLALVLQWGCAPYRDKPTPRSEQRSVIDAPPSARGNPSYYDVLGRRYYVLPSSAGYRERGIASWYGKDFNGLSTSGGETYDMYAMTAAHKTLPIPTWVEVTNLANHRRVIVKINDRGPFVDNRLIDLSYGAAKALDMIRTGTASVEVRALGAPAAGELHADAPPPKRADRGFSLISQAVADTVQPGDRPMRPMFLQVGAFAERGNAVKLLQRLKAHGYADVFMTSAGKGTRALHRVRIGPFSGTAEFERLSRGLRSLGIVDTQLIVDE
jgi:rare lipoprotein A